ncbi:MAG: hypothetical protein NVSMB69_06760 [Novosphingobium sp.]
MLLQRPADIDPIDVFASDDRFAMEVRAGGARAGDPDIADRLPLAHIL